MKVLLVGINAKYIHSNPAIYSLLAYAKKQGFGEYIEIAEYTINQQREQILMDIYEKQPDVVAFSCYIWNIDMVLHLIGEVHQVLPKVDIWLGGPEVSFHPDQLLKKYSYVSGIMIGEGEETFSELVSNYVKLDKAYLKQDVFSKIAGLYLDTGYTPERCCMNLDDIPFFYEDLTDFENRIVYYESSRGCPFRCSYCLSSIDKQLRFRSLNLVKQELLFFLENKVPQVKFIDRTFNAKHEHCMEIWSFIKEHDNGITNFHFEISADLLKKDELEILSSMRDGLVQLEIGVQTTNPQTIQAINRTMNLDKLQSSVEKINATQNIHQHLDLIAGLPYEDYESFHKSFNDVYRMRPEQLQLGFLKVLKGSAMEEKSEEYGIVYHHDAPYEVLYTNWLSYADVIRLKGIEEMVELFYNSGQFVYTIAYLEYVIGDAFMMYERLARFYKEKGLLTASSKRISHYENLLEFVQNEYDELAVLFKELLIFDCYLRENMKTYPEFAKHHEIVKSESDAEMQTMIKDITDYEKSYCRYLYQTEEEKRELLPNHMVYDSKQMAKMTHVEFFRFPVWEKNLEKLTQEYKDNDCISKVLNPVLFDYSTRNCITNACRYVVINS